MTLLQSGIFSVLGIGLLGMVYRSLDTGWLPCGSNGLKGRLDIRRHEQPAAYWLTFACYGAGGLALITYAVRLLAR